MPAFLLAAAIMFEAERIDALWVKKTDRLSRSENLRNLPLICQTLESTNTLVPFVAISFCLGLCRASVLVPPNFAGEIRRNQNAPTRGTGMKRILIVVCVLFIGFGHSSITSALTLLINRRSVCELSPLVVGEKSQSVRSEFVCRRSTSICGFAVTQQLRSLPCFHSPS
jgi:hypothetical protein